MPILAALPWAKIGLVFAVAFAVWFYGHTRYTDGRDTERAKWTEAQTKADKEILRLNVALVTSQLTASQNYAEKLSAQEPIILHDRTTVEKFAATPAGAAVCLPADRVRDIEATAAKRGFGDPAASEAGNVALHANPVSKVP